MIHRLHEAEMVKMWKSWVWAQQASRVGYEHTYQALERSPQSFQYTSLHCAAASHNLECLLYWSASQAAWCTPPVHRCSNTRTHNIFHACTASNKWGHVPPHSQVLLCWTGSSLSSCPCSCMTHQPLFLQVNPGCPVWLCTICMEQGKEMRVTNHQYYIRWKKHWYVLTFRNLASYM